MSGKITCDLCQQPFLGKKGEKTCECVTENYEAFEKMLRKWRNEGIDDYTPARFGHTGARIESKEIGGRKPMNR
jgi:hypothetical protein